jgi:hypothetical protein
MAVTLWMVPPDRPFVVALFVLLLRVGGQVFRL